MTDVNPNQAIFDAIVAAVTPGDHGTYEVNVQTFIDTFNAHRDRKLCTSLDVAQSAPETHGPLPSGEVDLTVMSDCSGAGAAQTPGRIEALEAALREIDSMAPATCEVTLAHQMADIASAALASPVPSTSHSRNQS